MTEKKTCSCCKVNKPLPQYWKDKSRKDGLENRCKSCSRAKGKRWREKNPNYFCDWRNRNEKEHAQKLRKYRTQHPNKVRAVRAVNKAVARGNLPHVSTLICIDCGKQAEHYHHESYKKEDWLKVMPLCRSCHYIKHRTNVAPQSPATPRQ